MSIRKRNEFLEGDDSDDEVDGGYDSNAEEGRGGIASRLTKRRRVDHLSDDESNDETFEDTAGDLNDQVEQHVEVVHEESEIRGPEAGESAEEDQEAAQLTPSLKASAPKHVAAAEKAARRSGVVYISRVPPFMKPQTLRHFLEPHASKGLGRLFLTPEDHAAHTRRVKSGGNKKKSFTDGWVEFVSKRDAKIAVDTLNGNIIGGKKGNFYHDDLWSMKYLKGFKWNHLTEQIANENAERAARMREEVRKTRAENKAFVDDVERGKMLQTMESKRKARSQLGEGDESAKGGRRQKEFKQKTAQKARQSDVPSEQMNRMRAMIF